MSKSVETVSDFTEKTSVYSDEDERAVLASINASVFDQAVYEDNVIRQASYQSVPQLSDTIPGFPSGMENELLLPLLQRSDVPTSVVLHSVLGSILTEQRKSNDAGLLDLLRLKEQIVLKLMETVSILDGNGNDNSYRQPNISSGDINIQPEQEKHVGEKNGKRIRRVPIMKRKRMEIGDHKMDSAATDEVVSEFTSRKELKELRALRRKKQQERYQRKEQERCEMMQNDDNGSSEEFEINNVIEIQQPTSESMAVTIDDSESDGAVITTVSCPLCQNCFDVKNKQDPDAALAIHISNCQNSRSTRRQKPAPSFSVLREKARDINEDKNAPKTRPKRSVHVDKSYQEEGESMSVGSAKIQGNINHAEVLKNHAAKLTSSSIDDIDEWNYEDRVDDWISNGILRMKVMKERDESEILPGDTEYEGGLFVPAWMSNRLFSYQRDGVLWMWNLHQQSLGGIIGDEMGLGKTVQVAAFLGAAASSRKLESVLIVAPASILQHWLTELSVWAPGLRRILIHSSGGSVDGFDRSMSRQLLRKLSLWLKKSRANRVNEPIDDEDWATMEPHSFCGTGYAIVTTYENLRRNADVYSSHDWSYVVLDEAQKIRNPDADITLAAKRIRTPHRLAISGTPIQNDLRELWSLFDFVFPGRLGTLPAFEQEFAVPIKYGGYLNASPMQVQLAYRCAVMLRDLIEPFLLRRLKKDVKEVSRMPGKTEHVLFCRLSQRQRAMYEAYLQSDDVSRVLQGNHMLLAAVTVLRKIANHPDLVCDPNEASFENFVKNRGVIRSDTGELSDSEFDDDDYANDEQSLLERSGKLEVLAKILPIWKKQGHRVLIFCQWRKMLNIIERFVRSNGWKFGRLDGNTNIASRQHLVDTFNTDSSYFGMLCTTRTGGVGLNLIGANRCILYDPDWNPSGDAQARERAWRFGQEKDVTIYRLITSGTIEEKIYHRQIFKTAMSNKVLQDPKQRRLFSKRELQDLFTLDGITQTSLITNGVGVVDAIDLKGDGNDDNEVALNKLMKTKGLAGVFDHHSVEPDHKRKSTTALEMEEKAKKVAIAAARALKDSVSLHEPFTPTWTGSDETNPGNFGLSRNVSSQRNPSLSATSMKTSSKPVSSSTLLATIRQRNTEIETNGQSTVVHDPEIQKFTHMLSSLKDFVRRNRPSTEQILKKFDDIPDSDVAIFRRLLKSVATLEKGRWYLVDDL